MNLNHEWSRRSHRQSKRMCELRVTLLENDAQWSHSRRFHPRPTQKMPLLTSGNNMLGSPSSAPKNAIDSSGPRILGSHCWVKCLRHGGCAKGSFINGAAACSVHPRGSMLGSPSSAPKNAIADIGPTHARFEQAAQINGSKEPWWVARDIDADDTKNGVTYIDLMPHQFKTAESENAKMERTIQCHFGDPLLLSSVLSWHLFACCSYQ